MLRRILLTLLIGAFLLSDGYAAEVQNLIIKVHKARDIHKIEKKYKVHVLEQIEDQPIFLVQAKHSKKLLKKLGKEKKVVSLEPDLWVSLDTGSETDSGGGLGLDWSVMSLFEDMVRLFKRGLALDWSVMSLFGEGAASTGGTLPPKFGHGTLVAGLIHAVAPEAGLVPIRAFDFQGNSTLFLATAAVYAAVDLNVDVINMSFSIGEDSRAFREALDYAWSHGVTLVASVGNDGTDAGNIYPAAYKKVIAVAATDLDDHIAPFSNYGKAVDVAAPGEIVSTYPGGLYARASGTSFSAPLVSGSVALLVSLGQRNNAATQTIVRTADSIDELNPDFKKALGEGRINLLNAIEGH